MLIFQEAGRLGNQLFQYAALRSICNESEALILLGFEQLDSLFDGIKAIIINNKTYKYKKAFYYRLYRYLDYLSQKGFLSRISEKDQLETYEIIYKKGFCNSIKFVEQSYFQNESLISQDVIASLSFKHILVDKVKHLLDAMPSSTKIFVHIRRGDHISWPNKDSPAILSASYYRKCMDLIKSIISDPFFIIISDDPFYAVDVFGNLDTLYISRGSAFEDFTLMSYCQGGILSASSFSWWGAYFSHLKFPKGVFLAPKYWAGHSVSLWFPPNIKTSFFTYVDFK